MSKQSNVSKFQEKITNSLNEILVQTIENRREYYNDHEHPKKDASINLVEKVSLQNAAIAGASSLIPGPWGMISIIPEITLIIKKQIEMVYDIGLAYGHEKEQLKPNLITGIVLAGISNGALGLISIHGNKVLIKRSGLRVAQKLVAALGGRVTQQVAKTALAKWIPIAGAAAIAGWTKYSTSKIGQKAIDIFSKSIVYSEDQTTEDPPYQEVNEHFDSTRIQILINLMKIDGQVDLEEIKFIENIINTSNLSATKKNKLHSEYQTDTATPINYSLISEDEKISILLDLFRLANIDNKFKPSENLFIKDFCMKVNIDLNDFEALKTEILEQ